MPLIERVDDLYRQVIGCNHCFQQQWVQHAQVDLPQPPWVGEGYEESQPRILVLQIKPGAGSAHWEDWCVEWQTLLIGYQQGNTNLIKSKQKRFIGCEILLRTGIIDVYLNSYHFLTPHPALRLRSGPPFPTVGRGFSPLAPCGRRAGVRGE